MGYIIPFDIIEMNYPDTLVGDPGTVDEADKEILEVRIGEKKTHLNFNKATASSAIGDRKTITVSPEHAFGRRRDELVFELEKKKLPRPSRRHGARPCGCSRRTETPLPPVSPTSKRSRSLWMPIIRWRARPWFSILNWLPWPMNKETAERGPFSNRITGPGR